MRVIVWGTYDTSKPRVRLLLRGLREAGVELIEIHAPIWEGVADKGTLGKGSALWFGLRLLASYPRLIWRFMRAPRADAILVSYPGHLDVLVLWLFAKLRGMPVLWDVFLSAYNTVVEDRQKLQAGGLAARVIRAFEKLAVRAVARPFMDTRSHADYLAALAGLDADDVGHVPVGVEPEAFPPAQSIPGQDGLIKVLFYGQFIPLHGIETIVEAARLDADKRIRWTLIGKGQMEPHIRRMLNETPLAHLDWIPWVDYAALITHIHAADVCLGVFGTTDKAGRVIPNKVFQILSAGKPLVTRESADLRALVGPDPAVGFVAPGDPDALLHAVLEMAETTSAANAPYHSEIWPTIAPLAVGQAAKAEIEKAVSPI